MARSWYWHIQSFRLVEPLMEPIERWQAYLQKNKPKDEVVVRLSK